MAKRKWQYLPIETKDDEPRIVVIKEGGGHHPQSRKSAFESLVEEAQTIEAVKKYFKEEKKEDKKPDTWTAEQKRDAVLLMLVTMPYVGMITFMFFAVACPPCVARIFN